MRSHSDKQSASHASGHSMCIRSHTCAGVYCCALGPLAIARSLMCGHAERIYHTVIPDGPGLPHGLGDVFRALIPLFSMSGESRIACLSRLRAMMLRSCCKLGPLPIGRSLIPRACRKDTLYGHTGWGNQRYTSTTYSIGDLDERAILPRMSSYRVLHHDCMCTLVLL